MVAAASYEARAFGVRSAMPMFRARHLCPELVVVDLRMEHYRSVSQQIRAILETHTELIEPLALDEFYLDVPRRRRHRRGGRTGPAHEGGDPERHRAHGVGRRGAQQVRGEDRLRSPKAETGS